MRRALLILTATMFGTNTYAQSVEERLTECIAQSQRIVRYADAWKASLEVIGERANPWDFAEFVTSYAYEDLLFGTIENLKQNNDTQKVIEEVEQATNPILLQTELIENMVEEAFSAGNRFENMSEYISACSTNFGGETYTLQDVISEFEAKNKELQSDIEDLDKQLKTTQTLLRNSENKQKEYEQTLISLKGFDVVAYLDSIATMGALDRNKEILEGRFATATFETAESLKCLANLRDKGKMNTSCKDTLTLILTKSLAED